MLNASLTVMQGSKMDNAWQVSIEDVGRLNPSQLTGLLRMLVSHERLMNNAIGASMNVFENINDADGGLDGKCVLAAEPMAGSFLPAKITGFQCKAQDMTPSDCAKALCTKTSVRNQVDKLFREGGAYVLFCRQSLNLKSAESRLETMRKALTDSGASYAITARIEIYDANTIRDWTNQCISAQVFVAHAVGRNLPIEFQTWEEWRRIHPGRLEYVASRELEAKRRTVRDTISKPKTVVRIIGLSGLGKTRLVLEALRPDSGNTAQTDPVAASVVYCRDVHDGTDLLRAMGDCLRNKRRAVVVADECSPEVHQRLSEIATADLSGLSLVTIDFESRDTSGATNAIRLIPANEEEIRRMLEEAYPGMSHSDLQRIASAARGFPIIAERLADAGFDSAETLSDEVLFRRILWGRDPVDADKLLVLEAFAVFVRVKVGDAGGALDGEAEFVRGMTSLQKDAFYESLRYWEKKGLLDRRGRYLRVIPDPVALLLATQRWGKMAPETRKELVLKEMPGDLKAALGERMRRLDEVPEAKALVALVTSPDFPFGQAEVLSTEQGSRLFRAFAEVNPEAAIEAAVRAFGTMSREELLEIGSGRRDLVRTLEILCWHPSCFAQSIGLLLAFAEAENETWSNNACGVFKEKFQILLSGTRTPSAERLAFLDTVLTSPSERRRELVVEALQRGLAISHLMRMGGTEQQGSGPPMQDWEPQNPEEIRAHYVGCLERLVAVAINDVTLAEKAMNILASAVVPMLRLGWLDEIRRVVEQITKAKGSHWPELLHNIEFELRHRTEGMKEETRNALEMWQTRLQPESLEQTLTLIVSQRISDHVQDEKSGWVDVGEQQARKLARDLAGKLDELYPLLARLLKGEQYQGGYFGEELASVVDDPPAFIERCLIELEAIEATGEQSNGIVLGGFLGGLRPRNSDLVNAALSRIAKSTTLVKQLAGLVRLAGPTAKDLDLMLDALKREAIKVDWLRTFGYGRAFENIPGKDVLRFIDSVFQHSPENTWVALEILSSWQYKNEERWKEARDIFIKLVTREDLLLSATRSNMDTYHWQLAAKRLLEEEPPNAPVAQAFASQIIALCRSDIDIYRLDHDLKPVLTELLSERHRSVTWPLLSEAWLAPDNEYRMYRQLGHILEHASGYNDDEPGVLDGMPDFLVQWCREKGDEAIRAVAEHVVLHNKRHDNPQLWTNLAHNLFAEFGDMEEFISGVRVNMGRMSWSGSAVPVLQRRLAAFEELLAKYSHVRLREWANVEIRYCRARIEDERKRDEERELGIY